MILKDLTPRIRRPHVSACTLPETKANAVRAASDQAVFTTGSFKNIRERAITIHRNIANNTMNQSISIDVLDAAAERLWQNQFEEESMGVEALSWICNVFGILQNSRYLDVLQHTKNNASSSKLRKYAKKALIKIKKNIESNTSQSNIIQYKKGDFKI